MDAVPTYLSLKEENISHTIIPLIIISFVLMTIAKFLNSSIFKSLLKLLFATKNFDQIIREEIKIGSISSVILITNYFFTASSCIFLSLYTSIDLTISQLFVFSLLLPFGLLILQSVSFWIIGLMSNEVRLLTHPINETFVIVELSGILLFLVSLIWVLNPFYSSILFQIFIGLTFFGYLYRTLKTFYCVLQRGAPWYYIILYLCTLEILPLVVIYYYIVSNFIK
jgi:hypothetical protein